MREISCEVLRRSDGAIALSFNFGTMIPSPDTCVLVGSGLLVPSTRPVIASPVTGDAFDTNDFKEVMLPDPPEDVRSYLIEHGGIHILEFSREGLERETIADLQEPA